MKKVVVYGAGAYAGVFCYEVKRTKAMEIAGFTVDKEFMGNRNEFEGFRLVEFENCEDIFPPEKYDMIVLCGYTRMRDRKEMYEKAKQKGYKLANYISPDAYIEEDVVMGENNIIFSNAFVGYKGQFGNGNIVRQNVYLGHQFQIGDHNIISSGVTIGGKCTFGNMCFVALGSTIIDARVIGNECLIGAGSTVVKNIDDYSKCMGCPAKTVSKHPETGVIV